MLSGAGIMAITAEFSFTYVGQDGLAQHLLDPGYRRRPLLELETF
jgi:hypothetical protein